MLEYNSAEAVLEAEVSCRMRAGLDESSQKSEGFWARSFADAITRMADIKTVLFT